MTILSKHGKTFYTNNTLSRAIDSTLHSVLLRPDPKISEVSRLADLPNEEFKLLANIQKDRKCIQKQHGIQT